MADCTKLGSAVKIAHHGSLVQLGMEKNVVVAHRRGHWRAIRFDHHGGNSHDVAACPAGVLNLLDGMANHASHAIFIERAVYRRSFGERTGKERDGVVATLAVARIFDSLSINQQVHVLYIERCTEGIGVR